MNPDWGFEIAILRRTLLFKDGQIVLLQHV